MADQAKENLNIEAGDRWMLNKIQKNFEIGTSKLNQKELEDAAKKAAELADLEKKFETWEWTTNETGKKWGTTTVNNDKELDKAIQDLNRPDAPGLKASYETIQGDVDDMKQIRTKVKNFFGFWPKKEKTQ